jgi:hypothetical protein
MNNSKLNTAGFSLVRPIGERIAKRLLAVFLVSSFFLTGCSSTSNQGKGPSDPANCRLTNEEIGIANSKVERDQDTFKLSGYTLISLFIVDPSTQKMILTNPQCFSNEVVSFVEQGSGRSRDFSYVASPPLEPKSSYEQSRKADAFEITDKVDTLQSSLDSLVLDEEAFFLEELPGIALLPELKGHTYLWSLVSTQSLEQNLQGNELTYLKAKASLRVYDSKPDEPELSITFYFDDGSGKEALCNGLRIESSGESFLIPGEGDCGWAQKINKEFAVDYLFDSQFLKSTADYDDFLRFLSVLAFNEFSIQAVDEDGEAHSFRSSTFILDGELLNREGSVSNRIRTLLEAKKGLELGLLPTGVSTSN